MEDCIIDVAGVKAAALRGGRGRAIVFLHGSEGIRACKHVVEALEGLGSVIAPSHPGFGESARPPHFRTIDDLAYFYLEMFEQLDIRDAVLIGANFGAWIASEIALRDSGRLSRLVLVSPVGARFATDPTTVEIQDVFTMDPAEEERRSWVQPELHVRKHASMDDAEMLTFVRDRESLNHFTWAPYMHSPLLSRWLSRIKLPTLVVAGEADGITPPEYAKAFAASIPHASINVVQGAAHMPHVEQVSVFVRMVIRFALLQEAEAA